MAKCLVTGHKGYIGAKLYKNLKDLGHEVVGIDLQDGHDILRVLKEDSDGKFHPHYFNFQPEYVFHMACWPRIGLCIEKPVETSQNNILATSVVLNFAKKCKSVKRVIYSSSSSVVGNGDGPTNPYALHKYTSELETQIYSQIYDLDTVCLRYFNVYSEDQRADGPYATAVANWMKFVAERKIPFITGDGEQRRDMIHVEDVVSANIFCMNYKKKLNGQVFDVGTGSNISLNEIKEIVQKFNDVKFQYTEPRPGEVGSTKANILPFQRIGWTHKIPIKKGIERCFNKGEKYEII